MPVYSGPLVSTKGERGEQGVKGETGAASTVPGRKGDTGAQGLQGPKGDTGTQGPKGDTGAQGPKGDAGSQGPQGVAGPTGATGVTGPVGATGSAGAPGMTFIGNVTVAETLLIALSSGNKRKTLPLAGVTINDKLTYAPLAPCAAGCEALNVYPAAAGQVTVAYSVPALAIGAVVNVPIAVYRLI